MATRMWKCLWFFTITIICLNFYFVSGKSQLHHLDEDNWDLMLTGEWMVEFYAPWCPACKALQPLWEDYSTWSKELSISVGQVDVTTSPGLSGRFMVTALPTIFHVTNGEFRQYRGPRDKESFMSFVEDKKWKQTEAIPSWKSPSSLQMTVVSHFFKLSQLLRAVHTRLMEDYGLPTWGSYFIFAIATIILGSLLGLLLVCIIDCIYPPKGSIRVDQPADTDKCDSGEDSDDDIVDDEIVDDEIVDENSGDKQVKDDENTESGGEGDNSVVKENKLEDSKASDLSRTKEKTGSGDEVEVEENEESSEQNNPIRKRKSRKAD